MVEPKLTLGVGIDSLVEHNYIESFSRRDETTITVKDGCMKEYGSRLELMFVCKGRYEINSLRCVL